MEDENADRVYVPGTNGTQPDRDVEPFWPPEELNAPVHGGKPVPRDAPPVVRPRVTQRSMKFLSSRTFPGQLRVIRASTSSRGIGLPSPLRRR